MSRFDIEYCSACAYLTCYDPRSTGINSYLDPLFAKYDRTKRARKPFQTWTKGDSERRGINHEKLSEAHRTLRERELMAYPGRRTLGSLWYGNQAERVAAILEKHKPDINSWNFDNRIAEALTQMGVEVTSPYEHYYQFDPSSGDIEQVEHQAGSPYRFDVQVQQLQFTKNGEVLLNIPVDTVDAVEFDLEQENEKTSVRVLVSHTDGAWSYYVFKGGRVTERIERTKTVQAGGGCGG